MSAVHLLALLDFLNLDHVMRWVEQGGYYVLFALLFACGLGLPLPEDIPLITAGILISQHHMHWMPAAISAWLGIVGGDCVLYSLGRSYGLEITKVPVIGHHVTKSRILWVEQKFERYGILVVGVGRLLAGVRGAMVVAAGAIRYPIERFLLADGLAAVVSGGLFMILGHWFGRSLVEQKVHELKRGLAILLIVAGISLLIYLVIRRRRNASARALDQPIAKTTTTPMPAEE